MAVQVKFVRGNTKQQKNRLVIKFGGTSLSCAEKIAKAVQSVKREVRKGTQVAVVVSAMGKTTDDLLESVSVAPVRSRSSEHVDDILSMGERTSARIFHAALSAHGVRSRFFDPHDADWPILTDDRFGDATPDLLACQRLIQRCIKPCMNDGIVPVLPGFVGKAADGRITTMGRGGSDITAFLLARCLPAAESILVTDTIGLMSADPKLVKGARPISQITVRELIGLADSGTKFLKTKALQYLNNTFRVRITSNVTDSIRASGTIITGAFPLMLIAELDGNSPSAMVTITGENVSHDPKIMRDLLGKLAHEKAKIIGFSAAFNALIVYVVWHNRQRLADKIHESVLDHPKATAMAVRDNLAFIKVVGVGLVQTPGLVAQVSEPLRENKLNIYGILTVASSIMIVVDWKEKEKALRLVRNSLRRVAR